MVNYGQTMHQTCATFRGFVTVNRKKHLKTKNKQQLAKQVRILRCSK